MRTWLPLVLLIACGGEKKAAPPAARDAGSTPVGADHAATARCVAMLERAAALPPEERAGTILRGCGICGRSWDHVLSADHADTGAPVDIEALWATVEACGGVCSNQAAGAFKGQLAELAPGRLASRPWRGLAKDCARQLHIDDSSERFASAAWYALVTVGSKLHAARAALPAAEQARIDAALASMLLPLPPLSKSGTGYIVPGGGHRAGTPWRHITVTGDAIFVGRLAFAHLSPHGLGVVDGGSLYPGQKLAGAGELAAALTAQGAPGAAPPPVLADRIDQPVIIAPRAAAAAAVVDAMAALDTHRAYLAVAIPAPAAMWKGLVGAHPMPLGPAAAAVLPGAPGPSAAAAVPRRLRFGLVTARVAVVDDQGAVLASAPLPDDPQLLRRWLKVVMDLGRDHVIEIVPETGKVDALAELLDVAAGAGVVLAIPAPAGARLTGRDLPAYDSARLATALGPAPFAGTPSPTRPPP